MKDASNALKDHLSGSVTSLAICWKLTLKTAVVFGFTDHSSDLIVDGQLYKASTGFSPTTIETNNEFSVDNLDIIGILDDASITEADLMAGVYDHATVEIFLVNHQDLSQGILRYRVGSLGEVKIQGHQFIAEIRGMAQRLNQNIGQIYTPSCRAILGDLRCGVTLSSFTVSATVDAVTNSQIFRSDTLNQDISYFTNGEVLWTSGQNAGHRMEVKEFAHQEVTLVLPMLYPIAPLDTFQIIAGCDKSLKTCHHTFENVINFRGEPHIPGMKKLLENASTASDIEKV